MRTIPVGPMIAALAAAHEGKRNAPFHGIADFSSQIPVVNELVPGLRGIHGQQYRTRTIAEAVDESGQVLARVDGNKSSEHG